MAERRTAPAVHALDPRDPVRALCGAITGRFVSNMTPGTRASCANCIRVRRARAQSKCLEAKPAPFQPKPGERARLVASPDDADQEHVGQIGLLVVRPKSWTERLGLDPDDPHNTHAFLPGGEGEVIGIHRDATWEPVEPSAPVGQARGETSGQVSDVAWRAFTVWLQGPVDPMTADKESFVAGYEDGRAAEAAAHAETKAMLERSRAYADSEHDRAERFKQNCVIEVQKRHDDYEKDRDHNAELIAELERVRAETWALGTERDELLDELAKLREGQLDCQKALAESERARLRLLDAVSDESMVPHPLRERIRDALAADQAAPVR